MSKKLSINYKKDVFDMNLLGRRFIFGVVAIICVSVVTVICNFPGGIYFKLVGTITGLFLASQSVTDVQKVRKNV